MAENASTADAHRGGRPTKSESPDQYIAEQMLEQSKAREEALKQNEPICPTGEDIESTFVDSVLGDACPGYLRSIAKATFWELNAISVIVRDSAHAEDIEDVFGAFATNASNISHLQLTIHRFYDDGDRSPARFNKAIRFVNDRSLMAAASYALDGQFDRFPGLKTLVYDVHFSISMSDQTTADEAMYRKRLRNVFRIYGGLPRVQLDLMAIVRASRLLESTMGLEKVGIVFTLDETETAMWEDVATVEGDAILQLLLQETRCGYLL